MHSDLIAKLEALDGPSREMDLSIAECFGAGLEHTPTKLTGKIAWQGDTKCRPCPPYTRCLTAVTELTERAFPGIFYHIAKGRLSAREPLYGAQLLFGSDDVLGEGEHNATPAIALVIALLRAKEARDATD